MSETWTLSELVDQAAARLEALPPPTNGQIRAVPDERTIRYYATLGLLDRPASMRGRTALYDRRHLAQVVAIKRMQSAGHSLADIQRLWPTMDDATLSRMSGVHVAPRGNIGTAAAGGAVGAKPKQARKEFWKREPEAGSEREAHPYRSPQRPSESRAQPYRYPHPQPDLSLPHRTGSTPLRTAAQPEAATTINLPLDGNVSIVIAVAEDAAISLSPADVRALRAAAAPLVAELANRGLITPARGTLEEEP